MADSKREMEQRNSRKRVSDLHRRRNGFVMAQISDGWVSFGISTTEWSLATLALAMVGSFGLSAMKTMKTACCLVFQTWE